MCDLLTTKEAKILLVLLDAFNNILFVSFNNLNQYIDWRLSEQSEFSLHYVNG